MPTRIPVSTRELIRRRPIARHDFRHGLRRFTMFNESQAWFDAHPEEWARLMASIAEAERWHGPIDPVPPHTRLTLRGEVWRER